jgi:hypothetical protein
MVLLIQGCGGGNGLAFGSSFGKGLAHPPQCRRQRPALLGEFAAREEGAGVFVRKFGLGHARLYRNDAMDRGLMRTDLDFERHAGFP